MCFLILLVALGAIGHTWLWLAFGLMFWPDIVVVAIFLLITVSS